MQTFVSESEMPGIGEASPADRTGASQASFFVVRDLGPSIQWAHSYVTDNMFFSIYRSERAEQVLELAIKGAAHKISAARMIIDPTAAGYGSHS